MNSIQLMGRLTSDVELKQTPSGVPVCTFSLAVDRPKVKDTTDFIPIVAWRNTAEFISRYFRKGNKIALTGVLTTRKWQDKDRNNRIAIEVVVDTAEFCESKQNNAEKTAPSYTPPTADFESISDSDELPF